MLALVVILLVVTLLLGLVTTGLLRSHADILRALHEIGVGVGDPGASRPPDAGTSRVEWRAGPGVGPPERSATSVHDLAGVSPPGDPLVVSMATAPLTLLAFLSSGCAGCAAFWSALADPVARDLLPAGVRVIAVTKGPEWESPDALAARAPNGIPVIMSTAAWSDYEVPGSPYFALVDGAAGVRAGEGVGASWPQVADLVRRAVADTRPAAAGRRRQTSSREPASPRGPDREAVRSSGSDREAANDIDLGAAGIGPGHPSLYPRRLEDVFAPGGDRAPSGAPPP